VPVADILGELEQKLACTDALDYISLAGSGEPTLNSSIGDLILRIKGMTSVPVAVLTNGSLLWDTDVQNALMAADLVIPSLDAGDPHLYRYVNRPHPKISFQRMVDGLAAFADLYKGEIWLEVFLLGGITGIRQEVEKIAAITRRIRLTRIQLNTVARPPAESCAGPLSKNQLLALKEIFPGEVDVIGGAGAGAVGHRMSSAESVRDDIVSMLSRRPCTASDVARSLGIHFSEALKHMEALVASGKAAVMRTGESAFYAARRSKRASRS
jgi:wyosine [tRNA(Phe)-imidazoG37] synthetase (radical SAM superfamily)